jgi:glycosyltransferase involved in cell wall biosynthesis
MKKVLIIAYYFPPLGGSGVQRTLKFVKYLPQYGWEPTVLTIGSTAYYAKDESLLKEIEQQNIRVVRTQSSDPNSVLHKNHKEIVKMPKEGTRKVLTFLSDMVFIPDNKIGWKKHALKAAGELLKNEKFDVIYATAPPVTDFLIGVELKKRFKVPLVIDYRDSWINYPYKYFPTPLHRYIHYRKEKHVVHKSDMIVTTSRHVKEELIQRHKFLNYNDIFILSHGYDPEDLQVDNPGILPRTEKMRFTYSGMFYGTITPVYFLQALAKVFKENPRMRGRIEACFVGLFRPEHINLVNQLGLQNSVNLLGYLEHKEAVKYLLASDVLWLINQDDLMTPGKLYEYIGTGKKILGCVTKGYLCATIEEAGGTCVDPSNVDTIASAITDLFAQFERNELRGARPEVMDKYNRMKLTGELAKIFTKYIEV